MAWEVIAYESESGQNPVRKFIKSLAPKARAKVIGRLNHLEEFGPELSMPYAKPIGKGLHELRIRGKDEIRIIYCFTKTGQIYLLHGLIKKTPALRQSDLRVATTRKKKVLRDYNL